MGRVYGKQRDTVWRTGLWLGTHRALIILGLAFLFYAPGDAAAQDISPLTLDPSVPSRNLAPYAWALIEHDKADLDWAGRMRLAELIALPQDAFTPVTHRLIGFGPVSKVVHLRIPIENPTETAQVRVLAFNDTSSGYQSVDLVLDGAPAPDAPELIVTPDRPWPGPDRHVHTILTFPPSSTATLYISYANPGSSAPLSLETVEAYQQNRLAQEIHIFVLFGLLVGVTVLTISLIGLLHRRVAFFYAGYIFCVCMHIFTSNAIAPDLFETALGSAYEALRPWWAITSLTFCLLFQRAYLAEDERIHARFRTVLLGAALALLVLNFGAVREWISPLGITLFAAICICLISVNGVIAVIKGVTGRWPFMFGAFAITATLLTFAFAAFFSAYVSWYDITLILLYGLVFEAITLALAMFAQVGEIRAQREDALRSELRLTQEKLEISTKMATAAHDMQQPLSSLRMALNDPSTQAGGAKDVTGAIDYLEDIVRTQIADPPDPDAQHHAPSDPVIESFDITAILSNLHIMFVHEAETKGLSFRLVPTTARAQTNAFAVMRILSNIVANAIRNTDKGGILIGCRHRKDRICIEVHDTGRGFDVADLDTLQEPGQRQGAYEGKGLGLSIVRQLCQENDLMLDITSVPGRGSVFRICVPKAD